MNIYNILIDLPKSIPIFGHFTLQLYNNIKPYNLHFLSDRSFE